MRARMYQRDVTFFIKIIPNIQQVCICLKFIQILFIFFIIHKIGKYSIIYRFRTIHI